MTKRVDGDRLWQRLMAMAEIGPGVAGGSNRQALSDEDRAGRDQFIEWAEAAGCTTEFDAIGNLFARRGSLDASRPPVLVGSHLDTQPTGGRFDGVYGVLGGLEVVETLNDLGRDDPVEIAVWTNEEGSRFQHSMMGSAVWAGKLDLAEARELVDVDGISVGGELDRLGWAGARTAGPSHHRAAFELHIEQGPILEAEQLEIGVVTGVQGLRWYTLELFGHPAHAGPTPMDQRQDPARALGMILDGCYRTAAEHAPWARTTFAMFRSEPVSPNTVPERIACSLDLRHPDREALDAMDVAMRDLVDRAAADHGITSRITVDNDSPPVRFDDACVDAVESAAQKLGLSHQRMVSGAGHDACYVAEHVPTSMIFVPCDDGLSHNEAENISSAQAEQGASVLLNAVMELSA
ncbi:MAG: Zn-dependent hydrolase [Actinomycetota bacterium]